MTESELKEAYLERVAWRERQVLKYLRRPYKGNLIEPYSGFFYLSNSERLKATIAGYKPSDIICFRDLDSYRRFVFSLEPRTGRLRTIGRGNFRTPTNYGRNLNHVV
jgi:hypothetical protein